jgi:hypothetical protein
MIAEIIPDAYDFFGKKVSKPTGKRIRVFHPTFPMGRFLTQPLSNHFDNINELRVFLFSCKYVSDKDQFGKDDYWLPPEEFEKSKKGDCEDFALYAWRQLIEMGIKSRFVVGESGRYGYGHAWITIERNGRYFLLEPLASAFRQLPRLSMIRYKPEISVEYNNGKISYYSHKKSNYNPTSAEAITLFKEWLFFWAKKWTMVGVRLILMLFKFLRKYLFHNKQEQSTNSRTP